MVHLTHSLAIQGHQSSSLLWVIITSKRVWRPLVRPESVLCAGWGLCLLLQSLSQPCAPCSGHPVTVQPQMRGSGLPGGSAAISGLGWALHSCRRCSGLSSAMAGATCSAASCPHSTGLLANYRGWQLLCLHSKAGPCFICLLPKIVWAQRATKVISTWKSHCFLPSSAISGIYILDEFYSDALQLTVIRTIIIIEEEQEDLSNSRYNIFLIPCLQSVRALTLAFTLCTQLPQKCPLEEEDTLATWPIPVFLLKQVFYNRTGLGLLSNTLV